MSNNLKLEAQISATSKGLVDALKHASGAVNETTQNWKNRFAALKDSTGIISQSIKNLSELIGDVGKVDLDVEGVDKIRSSIAEVSMSFQQVQGEIDAFTQKLVGMRNEASELGMPLEDFQRFSDAVQESGMSMDEAKQAIESMRKNIGDLANGVPEAQEMFRSLGLSIEQLSGNSVVGNFDEITKAIQATYPASEQAKSGMEMFRTSMEQAVKVSQEYNKLLIEQTDNAYATDKDVQGAISLSNAIGRLGEQIGEYHRQSMEAMKGQVDFARASRDLQDYLVAQKSLIGSLSDTYSRYVSSLMSGVGTTLSATDALKALDVEATELADNLHGMDASSLSPDDLDEFRASFGNIISFIAENKERLKNEMDAIQTIMNQRLNMGAPVDVAQLDEATEHVERFQSVLSSLYNSGGTLGIDMSGLREFDSYLVESANRLEDMRQSADGLNDALDLEGAMNQVRGLDRALDELRKSLKSGKITINLDGIDETIRKLDAIRSRKLLSDEQMAQADRMSAKFMEFKTSALDAIDRAGRSTFKRLVQWMHSFGSSAGKASSGVRGVGEAVMGAEQDTRSLKQAMDDFTASTRNAKGAADAAGDSVQKMAGRLAGMLFGVGSRLALFAKAIKTIGSAITYYWIDPIRNAYKETKRLADLDYERDKTAFDTGRSRYERRLDDLKKLYSLISEAEAQGITDELRVKMRQMQRMLSAEGVDIDLNFSSRKAKAQIIESMRDASKRAIEYYESELASTVRHTQELRTAYAQSMSYSAEVGDFSHKESIAEARQSLLQDIDKSQEREFELRDMIRRLKAEQDASQFIREDAAKARDRAAQALKKASKDLEDWADQLDMTEYQQKLKEVMGRIDEMLKSGKDWTEIMPVARRQVEALIQEKFRKENDARQKLVDALQQATEAYDRARQQRSQSARAVEQADKAYADAQRRAALDAQRERLASKRESLQRRMGQYGFSPYSGFRINESERSRRRRRRNARLDEGIAEKLQRGEEGREVSWTRAERRRLRSYQRLQRQDADLARRQKEMDAAERQRSAAVSLESASQSLRDAIANWKAASAEERKMFTEMEARRVDVENAQVPVLEDLDDTMQELLAWLRRQRDNERPPTRVERRREEIRQARERRNAERRRFLEERKPNESVVMDPYAKKEPKQNTGAGEAQPKTQKVVVYPIRNEGFGGQMASPWDSYDPKTGKPRSETIEVPVGAIDKATKAVENLTDVIDTVPGIAFRGENSPVENYGRALELLHRDMQEIASKTFRVV